MSDSSKPGSNARSTPRPRVSGREFNPDAFRKLIEDNDGGVTRRAAERIGISQPSVWKLLERVAQPKAQTLDKIARAYGVTTDWLYTGQGRTADDTFDQGVRYAVRVMKQNLEQLEGSLATRATTMTPPPVGSLRDRAPVMDPSLLKPAEKSAITKNNAPRRGGPIPGRKRKREA